MKLVHALIAAAICATLTACAGQPPKAADIAEVPHIQFGQPLPTGDNYVLRFPAGTPLPVSAVVDGRLFEQGGKAALTVTLKHDVYVYRRFASFDGVNWQQGNKLINTKVELRIPQKDGSNAGTLHVTLDQK